MFNSCYTEEYNDYENVFQIQILGEIDINLECKNGVPLDLEILQSGNVVTVTKESIDTYDAKGKLTNSLEIGQLKCKKATIKQTKTGQVSLCVQNHEDQLLYSIIDSELDLKPLMDLNAEISSMSWLNESGIVLKYERKIEILDVKSNQIVFTHEAPKKAREVIDFAVHPFMPNIICCCDDSKSVQIFWYQL